MFELVLINLILQSLLLSLMPINQNICYFKYIQKILLSPAKAQ